MQNFGNTPNYYSTYLENIVNVLEFIKKNFIPTNLLPFKNVTPLYVYREK